MNTLKNDDGSPYFVEDDALCAARNPGKKTVYAQMVGRASREPKAKHTQGPVNHIPRARDGHCDQIAKGLSAFVMVGCPHVERPILDYPHDNEQTANAKLIEEAFNVSTETGRTPRQLADDRAALIDALRDAYHRLLGWMEIAEDHDIREEDQEAIDKARAAFEKAGVK